MIPMTSKLDYLYVSDGNAGRSRRGKKKKNNFEVNLYPPDSFRNTGSDREAESTTNLYDYRQCYSNCISILTSRNVLVMDERNARILLKLLCSKDSSIFG